ncbi:MAG: ABC transporter permease [Anaerolineae bacterium]|jgi:ABC-2 type transport system permease protein
MGSTLRLYWAYTRASIRSQMAYRASFIMLTLGNFVATGIEFVALWALFGRFGQIAGWTLPEVALFYGLGNVAFAIAEGAGRGFDTFAALVKRGDFDRILLRPRSTVLQIGASEFQIMRIGRLSQGLAALIWGAAALNLVWAPWRIALLLWTLLCGAALFTGLFVLQATSAFWTTESLEVWNTLTYGGVQTAQFPLTLYEDWFRKFFTYAVPLAAITYFPAVAILAKDDPLGTSRLFQAIVPVAGLAFLAGATLFWQVGVRHYHSTGS